MEFSIIVKHQGRQTTVKIGLEPTKEKNVYNVIINGIDIQEKLIYLGIDYDYTGDFSRLASRYVEIVRWTHHLSTNYEINLDNIEK